MNVNSSRKDGLGIGPYTKVTNTIDANGNITQSDYYNGATLVATVVITYDVNGDVEEIERTA